MARHRSSPRGIVGFLILILFCLTAAILALGAYTIQQQVLAEFGPPSPQLSTTQRISYTLQVYLYRMQINRPLDAQGGEVDFEVRLGEAAGTVSARLEEAGLIPSAHAFRLYLVYTGLDTHLQAGKYALSPALTPVEIAHRMQDATPEKVTFHILPGWRADEIAASLPTSGLEISASEFMSAVRAGASSGSYPIDLGLPTGAAWEGFLFPGAYEFKRDAPVEQVVFTFLKEFDAQVTPEIRAGFERQGLSLYEAVTLASIVQREAVVAEEQPIIASVFYNRLADGMKLDSDPTVQYALGYNAAQRTWWTNPLSSANLQIDSPYNTYRYVGLPPGPIDNPGLSALQAVAFPAQTPYYYFRARCDGSGLHLFARTLEEQIQNACP